MHSLNNKNVKNIYDFQTRTPAGMDLPMSAYRGKAVLVVNTATKCGLAPQFRELEALHQKYRDQGLVILGFPCNQFQNQEPELNETMEQSCEINFGVTFQLTEKIMVNGTGDASPVPLSKRPTSRETGKEDQMEFYQIPNLPGRKTSQEVCSNCKTCFHGTGYCWCFTRWTLKSEHQVSGK